MEKKLPNIIIVEGIDRVGKTTLINQIIDEFDYSVFKPLYLTRRTMEKETEKLYATLGVLTLLKQDKIIFDRFHLSEYVYGYCNRGYWNDECSKIDEILTQLNSLLIYVRPTDIKHSSLEHGSSLVQHHEMFEKLFEVTKMRKIACDYNTRVEVIRKLKVGEW